MDKTQLENLAITFFRDLYAPPVLDDLIVLDRGGFLRLSASQVGELQKVFSNEEVKLVIHSMGSWKAPGLDGFQPGFYKELWSTVGPSLLEAVLEFFNTGTLPPSANDTLLVLIGKTEKPEYIT